jgi:NDP-sugar pyrophosphorylase family protein
MAIATFILAAGLGTRLRPLTSFLPKPLLPIGDRPALAHILDVVRPVALPGALVANAHHRADDLRAFVERSAPDLQLSEEARILGTAGGLRAAGDLLGPGPVLVWNGDILSTLDVASLVRAHAEEGDAGGTLAVTTLPAGEGNVGTDAHGRVVRLRQETTAPGEVRGGAFLGVHVVGASTRRALPEEGCLVGDAYLPALRAGASLRVFEVVDADWHDIGTLADYEAACLAWLARRGAGAWVGPEARVDDGVELRRTIVGRGARVEGEGLVERCIVWPDARVTAPCRSSVATAWGTVSLPPLR